MNLTPEQLERQLLAYLPLLTLVQKHNIVKAKHGARILGTSEAKFKLIRTYRCDILDRDEMVVMTAKLIHHFLNQKPKKR